MWRYLSAAFWAGPDVPLLGILPLNALAMMGCAIAGFFAPGFWFLGAGLEAAYLATLATNRRFQKAIDAHDLARRTNDPGIEAQREALAAKLTGEARARLTAMAGKCARLCALEAAQAQDSIGVDNRDALERLRWHYLKLLVARQSLGEGNAGEGEDALNARIATLQRELRAPDLSEALRRSKEATRELSEKRLAVLRRRGESLMEIDSDLGRIEAQVDLALESAALRGQPQAIGDNLDLVGHLFEPDVFGDDRAVVADLDRRYAVPAVKPRAIEMPESER